MAYLGSGNQDMQPGINWFTKVIERKHVDQGQS